MNEDLCILKSKVTIKDKLEVLITLGLVTPANLMPFRILNVINRHANFKAGMKVGDLFPIKPTKQQLCLTTIIKKQKGHTISEIINTYLENEASMLTINE